MPGMGGLKAAERIKAASEATLIVMISTMHPDEIPQTRGRLRRRMVWKSALTRGPSATGSSTAGSGRSPGSGARVGGHRLDAGRADLLSTEPLAEHVIGRALVENDEWRANRRDDRSSPAGEVPRRGVGEGELFRTRVGDEHARIQAGEDRGDETDRAEACRCEGRAGCGGRDEHRGQDQRDRGQVLPERPSEGCAGCCGRRRRRWSRRRSRCRAAWRARTAPAHLTARSRTRRTAECQVGRSVGREDGDHGKSGEDGVGAEEAEEVAVKTCEESSGTPCNEVASATRHERGAGEASRSCSPTSTWRAAGVSRVSRDSKETTRTISRTNSNSAM